MGREPVRKVDAQLLAVGPTHEHMIMEAMLGLLYCVRARY